MKKGSSSIKLRLGGLANGQSFIRGWVVVPDTKSCSTRQIEASRRALELEPDNQKLVNDLGWSLFQAGRLKEAEEVLLKAVAMDPADELARENLRLCKYARLEP
ncbi:MAG: tetratricopeptide repeat protein [Desulfobacteraceae bacterium]|nr:MAG: tetratricopeptide repeat protein [Desulfobacteraceae bacterium]